jgi:hypothetical protein
MVMLCGNVSIVAKRMEVKHASTKKGCPSHGQEDKPAQNASYAAANIAPGGQAHNQTTCPLEIFVKPIIENDREMVDYVRKKL